MHHQLHPDFFLGGGSSCLRLPVVILYLFVLDRNSTGYKKLLKYSSVKKKSVGKLPYITLNKPIRNKRNVFCARCGVLTVLLLKTV